MKKSVLLVTHMASMIAQFNMRNIEILQKKGVNVEVAANFETGNTMTSNQLELFKSQLDKLGVKFHQIDFQRRIGTIKGNLKAYNQLLQLCQNSDFSLIHCQSPLGSVMGRLVGHKLGIKTIYTCHGFQFFRGGPVKDWILYYPVEWFLARYTDDLITINQEDMVIAQKMPAKHVDYIPGVGVDVKKLNHFKSGESRQKLRQEFDVADSDFVLVSVGELSYRKNEQIVIRAIARLKDPSIKYLVAGIGKDAEFLKSLAKELGVEKQVYFLGYRTDSSLVYSGGDVAVFPSRREGLGLSGIEALAVGLPLLTTNVGGIKDYSSDGVTGFVVGPDDDEKLSSRIHQLKSSPELLQKISEHNRHSVDRFSFENVDLIMNEIYSRYLE